MRYDSLFQEELFGNTTAYPVQVYGSSTTLVQLLGSNPDGRKMYLHCHRKETKECLQQAFATAGSIFDPIGRGNMTEVIVPHDKTAKILLKKLPPFGIERRRILNQLQDYIVRIPDYQMEKFRELTKNRKGIDIIEETSYNTDTGIG